MQISNETSIGLRHVWLRCSSWLLIVGSLAHSAGAADKPARAKPAPKNKQADTEKFSMVGLGKEQAELIARLQQPVTLKLKDVPLVEVLSQIEEASGVPATVDAADLKKANLNPDTRFNGEAKERPADEVLGELLSGQRLDFLIDGGKLVVVSPSRGMASMVSITYDVSRLCSNAKALERLQKSVYLACGEDEWEALGGPASLKADPRKRTLTIKHSWSRQAAIRKVMRNFGPGR
jgi:type II secretory pathway component GspD/PulD (secretin)